MQPMLNMALRAARAAGEIISQSAEKVDLVDVESKGLNDYVTKVDRAAEKAILNVLQKTYPDHGFLGEETGLIEGRREGADWLWIIDPLDGTTNFIHGLPTYAVSIALLHRGQVTQAVVYDPSRNELFTASRGGGTFLNDRRVRVSGRTRYAEALMGAYWPGSTSPGMGGGRFAAMAEGCSGVRRMGATVLDLAYVASGRLDGFCGVNLKPWDLAAGSLLVLEAGGLIADFDGEQGWMDSGNVLAGSPKIFTQMMSGLQNKSAT